MDILQKSSPAGGDVARPVQITPQEFLSEVGVKDGGGVQGAVLCGPKGTPNDHRWDVARAEHGPFLAETVQGRKPGYITMASYAPEKINRWSGRKACNVRVVQGFWLDVEGSEEKGGYNGRKAVAVAVRKFRNATGLTPTHLLSTGSGGIHLHYVLASPITLAVWSPRADALVKLCQKHNFKIDGQCTTVAARIMRAPGSIHQKTNVVATGYRWSPTPYTLEDFDALVGYDAASAAVEAPQRPKWATDINSDVLPEHRPFSYKLVAQKCAAMRHAAQNNGRDTPYPVWVLALVTAARSVEGRDCAHEVSSGHPDYDAVETDRKLDSLTGGPASCAAWANAYGAGGPCESCEQWEAP